MDRVSDQALSTLGLINMDDVVVSYIRDHIAYDFDDDGTPIKTSVLVTKPERWSEQKSKTTIKNKLDQNHLNLPVVTVFRSGGELNKNIVPHWINEELLNIPAQKEHKTFFSEFYKDGNMVANIPTSVTLTYDINIISSAKKHNDHLLEQFIHHKGKYWKFDEYPFRASYTSFIDNSESADQSQERIISSSITIDFRGYVRPRIIDKESTTKREERTISSFQLVETEVKNIRDLLD